jgi:DNA-binding CsgD family transcriptional regulator
VRRRGTQQSGGLAATGSPKIRLFRLAHAIVVILADVAFVSVDPSERRFVPALDPRSAIVVASETGEIAYADPCAQNWLRKFFGRPSRAGFLPPKVCRWLKVDALNSRRRRSLEATEENERLFVRQMVARSQSVVLQLEVHAEGCRPMTRSHGPITPREAEVHHWIAAGKSNDQIAQILGIGLNTVGKHSSHLYTKLGVENRTAAAGVYRDITVRNLNASEPQ